MSSYYKPPIDPAVKAAREKTKAKKDINVSATSSLALANELASLKEKFTKDRERYGPAAQSTLTASSSSSVKRKQPYLGKSNRAVEGRNARDIIIAEQQTRTGRESFAEQQLVKKAKLYDALKKGHRKGVNLKDSALDLDLIAPELSGESESDDNGDVDSGSDEDDEDNEGDDMVEYEDEFGRTRMMARTELPKHENAPKVQKPQNLIYGDAIQYNAFHGNEEAMQEILNRDPNEGLATHYDASKEIRTKGVGFYEFSKDESTRDQEMEELRNMRQETEAELRKSYDIKGKWLARVERRRKLISEAKALRDGEQWLNRLSMS